LLLMDWSSECSTTPLVLSGPDGRPCLSRETLALARAGQLNRTKCTKFKVVENAEKSANSFTHFHETRDHGLRVDIVP
jgi:hypothetical protein